MSFRFRPGGMPWGRPQHELILLVLVAITAFAPIYGIGAQDTSRFCLTQSLVHGRLSNDACLSSSFDRARYQGHLYSDKAPGLSVLAVPSLEAVMHEQVQDASGASLRIWLVRILSTGIAFLVLAFLVGRIAEGLAPGFGGIALVAFALGTLVEPLAATAFGHVAAGAFGLVALVLAWRGRFAWAGFAAACAFACDYSAGLVLVVLAGLAVCAGVRPLVRYTFGALPGVAALGAYNWAAFGAPWHFSYAYVDGVFHLDQAGGFFGIGTPHRFALYEMAAGSGGLLVISPVLVASAWGLVLLGRTHRAIAIVCGILTLAFLAVNAGYFLPYGGVSPGPRFLVPGLPFLALGLGPAFARRPRLATVLTAASVVPATALMLLWAQNQPIRGTVWGELARIPVRLGSADFLHALPVTVYGRLGVGREGSALIIGLTALAALAVAVPRRVRSQPVVRSRLVSAIVVVSLYVVVIADVCSGFGYPYGARTNGVAIDPSPLMTTIAASSPQALPGSTVGFDITARSPKGVFADKVLLTIELPSQLQPTGVPASDRGPGCSGTSPIVCDLDFLQSGQSGHVQFQALVTQLNSSQHLTVKAFASTEGNPGTTASATITFGAPTG